ncbi:hypothetical protein BKA65DRAFT_557532 [Rhexocercosporidium sp. MPI-PUGE-AT-0058]|nr:hypothetical protein BKA65DRAFT_557532 [Rhexocercosporidium sp. MPI-PUGE-AT-0058]
MAELLGVVSSGMAVVSLAIQAAESIEKLKSFYSLIQSAPEDILFAIDELETLSMVFEEVDRSMQQQLFLDPRVKVTVLRSFRLCRSSGDGLKSLVDGLHAEVMKRKRRGSFKVALKAEKIKDFVKKLENTKGMMILANQMYYQAVQNQKWESLERDMDELKASHRQHHNEVVEIQSVVTQRRLNAKRAVGQLEGGEVEEETEETSDAETTTIRTFQTRTADSTIWKPRDYFLAVCEMRMERVVKKWTYIIHTLESSMNQYIEGHPSTVSRHSGAAEERAGGDEKAIDWILKTRGLLRRIYGDISDTNDAWISFRINGIETCYGAHEVTISYNTRRSLQTIKELFQELQENEKRVASLNTCCLGFLKALEFRLILEGKEETDSNCDGSGFAAGRHEQSTT